jgi:phosphoglycerol transferase MdoB-like AlkP superfamily enzyme
MRMYIVFELCLGFGLLLIIILSAIQGWLPWCRMIVCLGIIALTLLEIRSTYLPKEESF